MNGGQTVRCDLAIVNKGSFVAVILKPVMSDEIFGTLFTRDRSMRLVQRVIRPGGRPDLGIAFRQVHNYFRVEQTVRDAVVE